jgi:hypothetical protein
VRILDAALGVVLIIFTALQSNDPDAPLWIAIYVLAAVWALLGAGWPMVLHANPLALWSSSASVVLFLAGFAWLAPAIGRDWIHVEEAREALGLLICTAATLLALWTGYRLGGGVPGHS